jgi:secondary thiamine-phosphate synthase enzyme
VKTFQDERKLHTAGGLAVSDITEEVNEAVRESGIRDGIACVYSPHTTCCVRINEFETGFLEDFAGLLEALVPGDRHDCRAMLLGTAGESVPVHAGELALGTWQRVLFLELERGGDARWVVQVVGS